MDTFVDGKVLVFFTGWGEVQTSRPNLYISFLCAGLDHYNTSPEGHSSCCLGG